MLKKTVKYLFTPRTDSPTKAYYAGLITGIYLTKLVYDIVEEYRDEAEVRRLNEERRQQRLDRYNDQISAE